MLAGKQGRNPSISIRGGGEGGVNEIYNQRVGHIAFCDLFSVTVFDQMVLEPVSYPA